MVLASISAPSELKSLGVDKIGFLGGKRINGNWTWSEGTHFKDNNSIFMVTDDIINPGDCLRYNPPTVEAINCDARLRFLWCKFETTKLRGNAHLSLRYLRKDLTYGTPPIIVDHQVLNQNETNHKEHNSSNLNLTWYIEDRHENCSSQPSMV